ncbi:hypothetical protein [Ileibacterium valens]|nr:hypothetical protein [Ileibacterium valens]
MRNSCGLELSRLLHGARMVRKNKHGADSGQLAFTTVIRMAR